MTRGGEDLPEDGGKGVRREGARVVPLQDGEDGVLPGGIVDVESLLLLVLADLPGQVGTPVEKAYQLAIDAIDLFSFLGKGHTRLLKPVSIDHR